MMQKNFYMLVVLNSLNCLQCWDCTIWKQKIGGAIRVLWSYSVSWKICFLRLMNFQIAYDAKKILCSIGINYEMIHACPNDCILYIKDYEDLERCPVCEVDRYKTNKNKIPAKVLWYFLVMPRFKCMFRNSEHAKSLMWHSDERISIICFVIRVILRNGIWLILNFSILAVTQKTSD